MPRIRACLVFVAASFPAIALYACLGDDPLATTPDSQNDAAAQPQSDGSSPGEQADGSGSNDAGGEDGASRCVSGRFDSTFDAAIADEWTGIETNGEAGVVRTDFAFTRPAASFTVGPNPGSVFVHKQLECLMMPAGMKTTLRLKLRISMSGACQFAFAAAPEKVVTLSFYKAPGQRVYELALMQSTAGVSVRETAAEDSGSTVVVHPAGGPIAMTTIFAPVQLDMTFEPPGGTFTLTKSGDTTGGPLEKTSAIVGEPRLDVGVEIRNPFQATTAEKYCELIADDVSIERR